MSEAAQHVAAGTRAPQAVLRQCNLLCYKYPECCFTAPAYTECAGPSGSSHARAPRETPHGAEWRLAGRATPGRWLRYARLRGARGFFNGTDLDLAGVRDFDFGFAGVRDFAGAFGFDALRAAAGLVALAGAEGLAAAAGADGAAGLTGLAGGWGDTTGCSFFMRTRCCHWKR